LDGICFSCEVPSIAGTALGISEQYLFLCHQTGMVGHCIAEHEQYKTGALKRKRQVKQSGNILK
jgi:hypothetical protein